MRAWLRRWKAVERVRRSQWQRATVEDRWAELMDLVAFVRELEPGRNSGDAETRATEVQVWYRWQRLRDALRHPSLPGRR